VLVTLCSVHICQTGSGSQGVRDFIKSSYANIKNENPGFPFLIREAAGVQAKMTARFGATPRHNRPAVLVQQLRLLQMRSGVRTCNARGSHEVPCLTMIYARVGFLESSASCVRQAVADLACRLWGGDGRAIGRRRRQEGRGDLEEPDREGFVHEPERLVRIMAHLGCVTRMHADSGCTYCGRCRCAHCEGACNSPAVPVL
jgi:hypothetical protein